MSGIESHDSAQAGGLANIQDVSSMGHDNVRDTYDLTSETNDYGGSFPTQVSPFFTWVPSLRAGLLNFFSFSVPFEYFYIYL